MSKASMTPSEQDLARFWHHLSTPHQEIVWEIVQAFVALDTQQDASTREAQRMSHLIILDSGVLGLLTHPSPSNTSRACSAWLVGA